MDTARLERQMHAQRVRVERMLTEAMSRFSVQPEFKVTRGRVRDELRREAQSADLVVVGSRGANATRMVLLGSVPSSLLDASPCDLAIARIPSDFRRP